METKAQYTTIVATAQKIGNAFNLPHETVEIWIEAINGSGMPEQLLEERANTLISTWDNKNHYGKPTPADLIQGYSDNNGIYNGQQVGWIVGCMVSDRLGGEEGDFQHLQATIHNLVVHKLFEYIDEEGVIKRDKNGNALFRLSQYGKQYAGEIRQRVTHAELRKMERWVYPEAWRDEWSKLLSIDAEKLLRQWSDEGKDLLYMPYKVVER